MIIAAVETARVVARMLEPRGRVIGLTKGQFSMLDLITAVLDEVGEADVVVSTWTIARSDSDRVGVFLRDGRIRTFSLIIDRSFPRQYPEYCASVVEALGGAAHIHVMKTHAKFALIRAGEWRIVIRSSMNLNPNPRCEQFDVDDSPAIYDFFAAAVADMEAIVPAGFDVDGGVMFRRFQRLWSGRGPR